MKNEISIQQAKDLKEQLEKDIEKMIRIYESKTDTTVTDIYIHKIEDIYEVGVDVEL